MAERIEFAEAIGEELLFKKAFASLSGPQKMVLKAIYGLPLTAEELQWWSAFHGLGVYDELGYLKEVKGEFPYEAQEYEDITLIVGRRAGKSQAISSFVVAYEAICGGHKETMQNKEQEPVFLQVAQDLVTAKANLRQFILHWIKMSPVGKRELEKGGEPTADSIRLATGLITVGPPTLKLRSQAIAVCAMDELAVWPTDRESANPDAEVEIAVRPAMAQFPHRKLIKTSTPWSEAGLLWEAAKTGTRGYLLDSPRKREAAAKVLVLQAPTAAMQNPAVPRSYLVQEQQRDGNAFLREYLAKFAKSVTGFLSPTLLRQSVTPGVRLRAPKAGVLYVATMDPAFRQDAFPFCIGHLEKGIFIQDYLDAPRGTKEMPLSPQVRMASIASVCRDYGVKLITTDQYHDVSLQELAATFGLSIEPLFLTSRVKSQVWGDFVSLLNQQRLQLLDQDGLMQELLGMEQHLTSGGNVQIEGKHDDQATVTALCVHKALAFGERVVEKVKKEPSLSQQIRRNVLRRQGVGRRDAWWQQ